MTPSPKLSCPAESLTSDPVLPRGSGSNVLTEIKAAASEEVNGGLVIGVRCSPPLISGQAANGVGGGVTYFKGPFEVGGRAPALLLL